MSQSSTPLCIPLTSLRDLPTPAFVVDTALLERNLQVLAGVQKVSGAKIVLALKGFAMWSLAPLIRQYLPGVTASGVHEAMLGREKFGGKVHSYGPAYSDDEILLLAELSDHLSFNSFNQWHRYKKAVQCAANPPQCGLRINPEHSEVKTAIYDPCAPCSRLGILAKDFENQDLAGITGLHFHTLCELNSDALERTHEAVKQKFGHLFPQLSWINFGGGHHITRSDYDIDRLVRVIKTHIAETGHEVILEPGEAVALNTGVLIATVLDIVHNQMPIAILDVSATAHMPDVLEMPYRPEVASEAETAGEPNMKKHTYRLTGPTCLAGDVIGDYSFDEPLEPGVRLVFGDMGHYSMVKTTTFNGVPHPAIAVHDSRTGENRVIKTFGYENYRDKLS